MIDPKEIQIDEDIDISRLFSDNLKVLCCKYDSIFVGSHDNVDDIYFFDKSKRFFFTFTDGITSVYANMLNVTDEERMNTEGDLAFMSPILRAVYVLKGHRGKGLQSKLLQDLNAISEEYGDQFHGPKEWLKYYHQCTPNKYDFCYMKLGNPPVMYKNFEKVMVTGGQKKIEDNTEEKKIEKID